MDTTTQEPRRLRPAAGPSGPRDSRAGVDHAGSRRARGGAPRARGEVNRGEDNRGEDNRGGNTSGEDNRGGNARGGSGSGGSGRRGRNSGGSDSRMASSRAVNSGRVNGAAASRGGVNRAGGGSHGPAVAGRAGTAVADTGSGTGSRPGGQRHLRVVGQPAARVGLDQSATGAAARPSARPRPERSRTGARGTAPQAASGRTAPGRTAPVGAGPASAGPASAGSGRGEAAAPQPRPSVAREARPAAAVALPRIPFVLLVLALLGGGLVCLLVVNTTLGATSFRISQLQSDNAKLSLQEQTLLGQVAKEQSPQGIEQRAYQLGMRTPATSNILDLRTHRFAKVPDHPGAQGQDAAAPPAASTAAAGRHTARHHTATHRRRKARSGR
jgi:hypothetical protein